MLAAPECTENLGLAHLAIRASAGSGKTYQLVNRYLRLISAGEAPACILASTFTRLAAGQIRDQILGTLAEAVDSSNQRQALASRLGVSTLSREEIIRILVTLSHNLHRLQVRTLDSFFAAIVRGFAMELDLPLGAAVIDEATDAQIRREAVRLMLDERQPQELVDLLRRLIRDRAERGVCETINSIIAGMYDIYTEAPTEAWDCVPVPAGALNRSAVVDAIARLQAVDVPSNRKALVKAWTADLQAAQSRNWKRFLKAGIAKNLAAGMQTYGQTPLEPGLINAYRPLVDHARAEIVGQIREQTLASRELLEAFDRHYRSVKNARRAITFADLTHAAGKAEQLGTFESICFRIDATLRHMLLDEFQDTSIPQWRALQPLVQQIICERPPARSFFCVGDVKQSIYGWRSAAPEVLDELPQLLRGDDGDSAISICTLSKSYRSSPIVIDVVNRVFGTLAGNRALDDYRQAERAWSEGFQTHSTDKDFAGYVELHTILQNDGDADARRRARCRAAAARVADLHHVNPHMSIAVLTRTNPIVARMQYELGPGGLNMSVTGRGGGPLTDAPAVNVLLDLLHLADHPGDTVAAFNVARSPAGPMIGLANHDDPVQRHRAARNVRRLLSNHGYAAAIAGWVQKLAPACDEREVGRLVQLVELAGLHDQQPSLCAGDFIHRVETTRVSTGLPAAVQVMTIHQAKGLEFDAVVLPELDQSLTGSPRHLVFERADANGDPCETGTIRRVCCHIEKEVRPLLPQLEPLFERHERRTVRESLSLLYVAMTRAKRGLYMFVDTPDLRKDGSSGDKGLKSPAGILRCALERADAKPGEACFTLGDPDWMSKLEAGRAPAPPPTPAIERIRFAKSDRCFPRGIKARAASQLGRPDTHQPGLAISLADSRARGVVIHSLFEQIEWLDDFSLDDQALLSVARRTAPRRDHAWHRTQIASFQSMLKKPAMAKALSRGVSENGQTEVHREHPFARIIDGAVQQGSIDRLVVRHDSSRNVISADIIDFKTDSVDASACVECAGHYRAQMQAYREVTAQWLGVDEARITMTLLFVEPGVAQIVQ